MKINGKPTRISKEATSEKDNQEKNGDEEEGLLAGPLCRPNVPGSDLRPVSTGCLSAPQETAGVASGNSWGCVGHLNSQLWTVSRSCD